MSRLLLALVLLGGTGRLAADEPEQDAASETPSPPALNEEATAVLQPLFETIKTAPVSRVTVEMLSESKLNGDAIDTQKSTFQIASLDQDNFTIYFKQQDRRTRIFSDEKETVIALAPDAYTRLPENLDAKRAVTALPIALGPYPEPVLALSLAGVDPGISLTSGMQSLQIIDRDRFANRVDAVHLRGVQLDQVQWDLWIATGAEPRPLRLFVDLTPMLRNSKQMEVPEGFSYEVRFDFLAWRMSGEIDKSLFKFNPPKGAKEYDSIEAYYESIAGLTSQHPLLGKAAPTFEAETIDGEAVESGAAFKDKVVVLDFWASWCKPCLEVMPILKDVTQQYADKDVVYHAMNMEQTSEQVQAFLKEKELDLPVLMDPDGEIADEYRVDALPMTFVIGKDGSVESVHLGFPGPDALRQRLTDELEVLTIGGRIATAPQVTDEEEASP